MADRKGGKAAAAGEDIEQTEPIVETQDAPEGGQASGEPADDLSEEAHLRAISDSEAAGEAVALTARSAVWDLRDKMLALVKHAPRVWTRMSQAEQRDWAATFEQGAQEAVRQLVEVLAANGQVPVRVLLTKVTLGDKIQITGEVKTYSEDEEDVAVGLLHSARGKHVMLTVASKDDYQQGQRDPETDEDEPPLNFEAGDQPPGDDSDLAGAGEDEQEEEA